MDMIEIRLKCKHFIQYFDHVYGVLNNYKYLHYFEQLRYYIIL